MKKSLIRSLLDRRVPQIIGSYLVGSTTLIFFISDVLIAKYSFSDHILSIALFGLISILPSVLILAYFHGAPGKDEWTRVEKFGIPINILFIVIALFTGYKYNVWQDPPPDHSKVYDSFIVHISSNQKNIDQLKLTEFYLENAGGFKYITGGAINYIDSIYPVDNKELERIRRHVNVTLNKAFMNYGDITINYPDNQKEFDMMDSLSSLLYLTYLDKNVDDEELQKKKGEELKLEMNRYNVNYDYFNKKHNTYVDKIYNIEIYKILLSNKGKIMRNLADLKKRKGDIEVYVVTTTSSIKILKTLGIDWFGFFATDVNGEDIPIEQEVYENTLEYIKDASFGTKIGKVDNIIDSNLVTIKLNNLDIIKGTDLIFLGREYFTGEKGDGIESFKRYIKDNIIIYNYFYKHPDQIEKSYTDLDESIDYSSTDHWLTRERKLIDSLETNFQTIIDDNNKGINWGFNHNEFRYYLRILNIQDSIATAKITGSIFPFAKPMIGDEINIK